MAQEKVPTMDLGEGVRLMGLMLHPVVDPATQELVIRLEIVGGVDSPILGGFAPKNVPVGELTRLPLAKVRAVFKSGVAGALAAATAEPTHAEQAFPDAPRLILGGKR